MTSRQLVVLGGLGCAVVVAISIVLASKSRRGPMDPDHPEKTSDGSESEKDSGGSEQKGLPGREASEDPSDFVLLTKEEFAAVPERLSAELDDQGLHPADKPNDAQDIRSCDEQLDDDESGLKDDAPSPLLAATSCQENDDAHPPASGDDSDVPELNGTRAVAPATVVKPTEYRNVDESAAGEFENHDHAATVDSIDLQTNAVVTIPPKQIVDNNCELPHLDESPTEPEQENLRNQSDGAGSMSPKRRRHRKKKKNTDPAALDMSLDHSEGGDYVDVTPADDSPANVTELLKAKTRKVRNHNHKSGAAAVAVKELQSSHMEASKKKKKSKGKNLS